MLSCKKCLQSIDCEFGFGWRKLKCPGGHDYSASVYCDNCYESLKSEFEAWKTAYNNLLSKFEAGKKQLAIEQYLKEDASFTGKWCFNPGEPSPTSDVTLSTSDGSQFQAHTLILANRSDVFRAMFEVDMMEKRTGEVLMEDVRGESVKVFLRFLYTAQVRQEDMEANYKELVKLAHLYQVKLLLQRLDMFIVESVATKESVIELLKMAYTHELERSKDGAVRIVADDPDDQLFNMSTKEFEEHSWMVTDFSKCVVHRLKRRRP